MQTAYLASEGFLAELLAELDARNAEIYGDLVLLPGPAKAAIWAENIWHDALKIPIDSIGNAANTLRAIQRNWALYPYAHHRRAALIAGKLPKVSARPLVFGQKPPVSPLGSWTLIDRDMLLAAARCSSPFPNGKIQFVEDRITPPSRAYLKLWEAFTVQDHKPQPGEICLDLGASPGGWSWVLQTMGARVISVDKAPLAPHIAGLPGIEHRQESAFGLDPRSVGPVDWLLSDIACYPERLLSLVQRWVETGLVRNFLCTIKLQGETDFNTIRTFAAIPGARLYHLHHNKHELTWICSKI